MEGHFAYKISHHGIQWIAVEDNFTCDIVKLSTMASDGLHIVWKDTLHVVLQN